ncbi:hypothetical protein Acy02nite_47510 [Actinoplanes cyaneus]|uniref:Uncharacterized protein n=1 Tax=Actinoplanes cyaneus TaxID=52696 RepID=A0A919IIW9_9ACTN|nr:hypothetical protein [Actinoplanes cyaneus]MCW2138800.1 hypothetical protein [Actinoplanes cyaneus]GID66870.1 hypothetical protein Acy02nite_47510 [Actinoplanes cyaneus]
MKAFWFRYDAVLQAVLAGEHRLLVSNPLETGRHVRKVQQALLDSGFALPVHGRSLLEQGEAAAGVVEEQTERGDRGLPHPTGGTSLGGMGDR